ncbi:MAG: CinA family protein [Rhodospirillales bacterium]|nr:CinA family protein [Rhodospirillales bacterium]
MFTPSQLQLADAVLVRCRIHGIMLATAESCTGGLIAACLTAMTGSSAVVERGFVTYTNQAKIEMLGVPAPVLEKMGAVSEEVAREMAEGTLRRAPVQAAIAVTGIAGPGGGSDAKPVGLVHIAAARSGQLTMHECHQFAGDRDTVRAAALEASLRLLVRLLD